MADGFAELFAGFIVRNAGTVDLYATFEAQASSALFSELCVHTFSVSQDLNTWSEYDPEEELGHDCNDSWWQDVPRQRANTSLTKDVSPSGIGSDFFHEFILNIFDITATLNGDTERICAWAGSLALDSQDFYGLNDFQVAALIVIATDTDNQYQLKLIEKGGNEFTMPTVWPNYQDRYIVIYKEGAKLIALSYQDAAHTVLEDRAEITLSGDLNFRYISMPMAYGHVGLESSSGYIDPIFGSFEQLFGEFEIQDSVVLFAEFEIQDSIPLFAEFEIQDSAALFTKFEVGQDSEDLYAKFEIQDSVILYAKFEIQDSVALYTRFRVRCSRRFGGNWQRKMWFDGTYYWRGRYDPTVQELKFEHIIAAGLASNVWIENTNAAIDTLGFHADWIPGDFTVRGTENGIPTTIHYSDGEDTWVAESDESSATGWIWENLTKVFEGTAPDWYRRVNLCANRKTPVPKLWAVAVFYDDDPDGKQWVKASAQTTGGDIAGWDAPVNVSDITNTGTIYGCSVRSMGSAGPLKNDIIVIYKEDVALRSRYFNGGWQGIQDIDTTTLPGRSVFDFEHGEVAGENEGHIIYVDADESVKWRERDSGGASLWSGADELHAAVHVHYGVGIVEHGSGWLWAVWVNDPVIEYRLHLCATDIWYPLLVNNPLIFDTAASPPAVITTTTAAQPQTPDAIPAGSAIPVCWVGQIAVAPCELGWGILIPAAQEDLFSKFIVRHTATVDLYAKLELRQATEELFAEFEIQDSEDLYAKFEAQATEDLYAKFESQVTENLFAEFEIQDSVTLFSKFIVRHTATTELYARFRRAPIFSGTPKNLFSVFEVRYSAEELYAYFEVGQDSENLYAEFETYPVVDLYAKFRVRTTEALFAKFIVKNKSSADIFARFKRATIWSGPPRNLFSEFEVRYGAEELYAEFEAQVIENLFAKFEVGQGSESLYAEFETYPALDLYAKFEAQAIIDLFAKFEAQVTRNLFAEFEVQDSAILFAEFEVGQGTENLYAKFESQVIEDLFAKFEAQVTKDLFAYFVTGQAIENLYAKFEIKQSSVDLFTEFEIQHSVALFARFRRAAIWSGLPQNIFNKLIVRNKGSADLIVYFEVGQGSESLYAEFETYPAADLYAKFETYPAADLYAKFETYPAADLYAKFEIRYDTRNPFAKFMIRQIGVADLFAYFRREPVWSGSPRNLFSIFEIQDSAELFSKLIVRHTSTINLYAKFELRQATEILFTKFRMGQITKELYAKFVTQVTKNIFSEFTVRHPGITDLFAKVIVGKTFGNLFSKLVVRNISSVEFYGKAIIRHSANEEMLADFTVRSISTEKLFAEFEVQGIIDLYAKFFCGFDYSKNLYARFHVGNNADLKAIFHTGMELKDAYLLIIDDEIKFWLNLLEPQGRAFIGKPTFGIDAVKFFSGTDSLSVVSPVVDKGYKEIVFGRIQTTFMQHDKAEQIYSKYSLCPDFEIKHPGLNWFVASLPPVAISLCSMPHHEMSVVSLPAVGINLCTLNREAMILSPTSVYGLSTAVT